MERLIAISRFVMGRTGTSVFWRYGLAFIVALMVVIPGLGPLPVTDRDEARFAQASKQMIETGDLIDIRFQQDPRWKKPAGIYWLQAASASVIGGVEAPIWAYRLPSAIAAVLAALALVWAAAPLIGGMGAALAGVMLATSVLFAVEANIAKTDAALMLTAILALGALIRMTLAEDRGPGFAALLWVVLAASILLKGPIVPVIGLLALVVFAMLTRDWSPVGRMRVLWGVPLMVALVAPWLAAIWVISDGAFFTESLGKDFANKVAAGQESHWGPPGLYALLVWFTFWPWAALIPKALPWLWSEKGARWLLLLFAWAVPFWVILEMVPTKLPHYVLPLYPALAIMLAAWAVSAPPQQTRPVWSKLSAGLVMVPATALGLACIVLPLLVERQFVAGAVVLGLAGIWFAYFAARAALSGTRIGQISASVLSALCLYPAAMHFALPSMATAFPSPRIAALVEPWQSCASGPLISAGYREPSLVFLTETGTQLLSPDAVAKSLSTDPGALVMIEDRWWPLVEAHLPGGRASTLRERLAVRSEITYFNYNRGKTERATLVTQNHPRWSTCVADADD